MHIALKMRLGRQVRGRAGPRTCALARRHRASPAPVSRWPNPARRPRRWVAADSAFLQAHAIPVRCQPTADNPLPNRGAGGYACELLPRLGHASRLAPGAGVAGVNGCGSSSRRTGRRSSWRSHSRARCSSDLTAAGPDVQRGNSRINIQTCRTASMANLIIGCTANRDMRADRVPPENRILSRELGLLGVQAARMYSLIRPLRTGFRRIWRAWKSPAVMQGGWCSASGTRWPMP